MRDQQVWIAVRTSIQILLLLILALWMMHACAAAIERQGDPAGELNRGQRAEVMSRTGFEQEQHIDLADRMLAGRVEKNWREGK